MRYKSGMAARKAPKLTRDQLLLRLRAAQLELDGVEARRKQLVHLIDSLDRQLIADVKAKHREKK